MNAVVTEPPHVGTRAGALTATVLLVVTLAAALATDVVKTTYGIKGDEATYVGMALSLAFDHDLSYERRDLERFAGLYRAGPEGVFLKRGSRMRVRFNGAPPFVSIVHLPDVRSDRLYFGKAFAYPLAVAPFVRVFGLNGFLVFHVLLLFVVCVCGYEFLAARSRAAPALIFTIAFVGAAAVPVWAAFLTSDLFNFALVFVAYFLWLYKEVAPSVRSRFLAGRWSDAVAAILLGVVTFSKLSNALLIVPMVVLYLSRRQLWRGILMGLVCGATAAAFFGANALNSGDFNYQGGERKTFYGVFPFDAPDATWEHRGLRMTTNSGEAQDVLENIEPLGRLRGNIVFFLIGRHFGFVPYFFPGVVAILLWLFSRERWRIWRVAIFGTVVVSTFILLLIFPYTWSGGGGPPGNRYFLSLYPALFFLLPPLDSAWPGLLAWVGGALFTAKMLVNPFVAAKFPYQTMERGPARRLPVEVTMANDLPIILDGHRSRVAYGQLLLYILDENAFPPENGTVWVSGSGRADILVRSVDQFTKMAFTVESPINTTLTVSIGSTPVTVKIVPNTPVSFEVPARGVRGLRSYAYLMSARSTDGFTPHILTPTSTDYRNLGANMRFQPVGASPVQ